MITPRETVEPPLRIGLFGIGLDAYWPQFAGLKERLEGYLRRVGGQAGATRGRSGQPRPGRHARQGPRSRARFRQADVDLIFLHVTTYALSSTVLPVVRRAKVPVIILNLSPGAGDRLRRASTDWATARR